jgi:hypothetical protein
MAGGNQSGRGATEPLTQSTDPSILEVTVVEARKLANRNVVGKPDTYVSMSLDGQQPQHTTAFPNSDSPKWDQKFTFNVANVNSAVLRFELRSTMKPEPLGIFAVRMAGREKGKVQDVWIPLLNSETNAELHVRVCPTNFGEEDTSDHPIIIALKTLGWCCR